MKVLALLAGVLLFSTQSFGDITPTIKSLGPKKTIHISSTLGGVSHIAWTLEIGKVLAQRGHNVSFITVEGQLKFGIPYLPEIQTISLGPRLSKYGFEEVLGGDTPFSTASRYAYKDVIDKTYKSEYYGFLEIFQSSNTDIAICDHSSTQCADAARTLNIPLILHMTNSFAEDASAPFINNFFLGGPATTKNMSFKQRLYNQYIRYPKLIMHYTPIKYWFNQKFKEVGIEGFDYMGRHSQSIKMINSFWGMESPRPVGPFVEYVGPIIRETYDSLPESMETFMDNHNKVVYIAFGQTYSPSPAEFEVLLTSLLEAYERKYFDGLIWSFSLKSRQKPNLPKEIKTQSGRTYVVQDLFDNILGSDIRFEKWSPQFAILHHAHCKLFISHGGATSIHESLFNGVPLLLHPFISDQPANAISMKDAGVGLILDRKAYNMTDSLEKIGIILNDEEGIFKSNMESMQTLVQLRSSKRKIYAADMIEEVLYSLRNKSDIWYRREVSADMGYLKRTNWDITLFGLLGFIAFVYGACKTLNKICAFYEILFVPLVKKYKTA